MSVCPSVCLSVSVNRVSGKNYSTNLYESYRKARHNPGTSRLDFGGNPDVNSDPGIFVSNSTIAVLAMAKAPRCWFGYGLKIRRIADIRLNTSKVALAEDASILDTNKLRSL